MFWHNVKYSLKTLFRSRMLLFWTFAFPIILGTFFHMAFSNIENSEKLDIIKIAVVDSQDFQKNESFKEALKTLSDDENEHQLFHITYTDLDQSRELLKENEIDGYLQFDKEDVLIKVNSSGINQTILKFAVDEINGKKEVIETIAQKEIETEIQKGNDAVDYAGIYAYAADLAAGQSVEFNNISNSNLSYTMIEYYTLIAMAALYGGVIAMFIINYKLANMNSVGKRTSISPMHKGSMLLGSLLASYLVQLLGLALLFIYTIFVLKVDYGNNLPFVVLLASVGSLAGLAQGVAVATLVKTNENAKTGILIGVTMFGCFLSGMMGITMKYVIDKNIPLLNKINPAGMITDGFYSLYYYDTFDRFYFNVISLLLFSGFMIALSYRGLRRQKYDSI